jgi:hypothetical protein
MTAKHLMALLLLGRLAGIGVMALPFLHHRASNPPKTATVKATGTCTVATSGPSCPCTQSGLLTTVNHGDGECPGDPGRRTLRP